MSSGGISAEERDALHDLIVDRLSGIDDLVLALSRKDYGKAEQLAVIYSDYLTVVLEDLGWSDRGPAVESFSTPIDVRIRVFDRLRAAAEQGFWRKDQAEVEELERRNRLAFDACIRMLDGPTEAVAAK